MNGGMLNFELICFKSALQLDDGDAGSAKAYVLVMEAFDALNGSKIVADILTQGTGTRTVEYPDPGTAESYGVVDKVGHILQSFVDTLTA